VTLEWVHLDELTTAANVPGGVLVRASEAQHRWNPTLDRWKLEVVGVGLAFIPACRIKATNSGAQLVF
jgi:hypothetical protein